MNLNCDFCELSFINFEMNYALILISKDEDVIIIVIMLIIFNYDDLKFKDFLSLKLNFVFIQN